MWHQIMSQERDVKNYESFIRLKIEWDTPPLCSKLCSILLILANAVSHHAYIA